VSAAATPRDLAAKLERASASDRVVLDALRDALATLTSATYGRDATRDESALDAALDAAAQAASSVRGQHMFPRTLLRRWTAPAEIQA
jgi:hypothetical protein